MAEDNLTAAIVARASASPFAQPARDNAGNLLPDLRAHQQRSDAPASAMPPVMVPKDDYSNDPNVIHLAKPGGGTIYKCRTTGRILGEL